jgi:hypothetical protein
MPGCFATEPTTWLTEGIGTFIPHLHVSTFPAKDAGVE